MIPRWDLLGMSGSGRQQPANLRAVERPPGAADVARGGEAAADLGEAQPFRVELAGPGDGGLLARFGLEAAAVRGQPAAERDRADPLAAAHLVLHGKAGALANRLALPLPDRH